MEKLPAPSPYVTPEASAYAVQTEDMSHLPGFAAFAQPTALKGLTGMLYKRREQRAASIEAFDHRGFGDRLTAASQTDIAPSITATGVAHKPKSSRPRDVALQPDPASKEQIKMTKRHRRNAERYWKKELDRQSKVAVFGAPEAMPRQQSIWSYNAQKRSALKGYYNGQPYTPIRDLEPKGRRNPTARKIERTSAIAEDIAAGIQESPNRWQQQAALSEERAAELRRKNKIALIRSAQKAVAKAHSKEVKDLRIDTVAGRIDHKDSPAIVSSTGPIAKFEKPKKHSMIWSKRKIGKYLAQLP